MSINNNTIKAVAATFSFGHIEVSCYQLPDGSYRYGLEVLAEIADHDKQILSNKKSPYLLSNLLTTDGVSDTTSLTVKVETIGKAYNFKTITQAQFGTALLRNVKVY